MTKKKADVPPILSKTELWGLMRDLHAHADKLPKKFFIRLWDFLAENMARLGRTQEEIDIARWQCVTEAHAEGRSWAKSYAYTAQQFNHPCYGPLAAGPDMMAHSYKKIQRTGLRLWAAKTELKLGSEKTVVEIRVLSKEKRGDWRLIA